MPAAKDPNKYHCERCGKTLASTHFYSYRDGTKVEMCKDCLTAHVDNYNPSTFLWLLEKMNVPYIRQEWNQVRDKEYAKDPRKGMGGPVVFGRYLGKMKLKQFIDKETGQPYTWADSQRLQEEADHKSGYADMTEEEKAELEARNEDIKQKFLDGAISEAEYKTLVPTETQIEQAPDIGPMLPGAAPIPEGGFLEDNYISEDELPDPAAELTDEDKIYLAMKWGRLYKPNEWVELEKKYTEMMNSFDIQDADSRNTLILMCKTDLKMNQALDIGDIDGYQKLARVSDSLRKSGKFTAAQNKDKDNDQISCVGQLVAFCEREEGFIPRFVTDAPQDVIDVIIEDNQKYLYNLVTKDLGFGQQIENYLKKIQLEHENIENAANILGDSEEEILDEDIAAYYEKVEEEKLLDSEVDEFSTAYNRPKESDDNGAS